MTSGQFIGATLLFLFGAAIGYVSERVGYSRGFQDGRVQRWRERREQ